LLIGVYRIKLLFKKITSKIIGSNIIDVFIIKKNIFFHYDKILIFISLFLVEVFNFIKKRMVIHINLLVLTFSIICIDSIMFAALADSTNSGD